MLITTLGVHINVEVNQSPLLSWLDQLLENRSWRNIEVFLVVLLILVATFTRFYDLESRVMSHDESEHTYFSWFLAEHGSYQHTPITHGPLQFHLLAITYQIFGDTDASSRFPAAAAGVLAIILILLLRRWLGRTGTLLAMALMIISPYMLFYTRYVRNEALILPVAILMFVAVIRYYETRQNIWLYLLAGSLTLHYLIKETAFIYAVELMLFLGGMLLWNLLRRQWKSSQHLITFLVGTAGFITGSALLFFRIRAVTEETANAGGPPAILIIGLLIAIAGLLAMIIPLIRSFGSKLRTDFPSLDMFIVVVTLTLPQLGAFPANFLGWDPLDYSNVETMVKTWAVVVVMFGITVSIGIVWDWKRWPIIAGIFFIPYIFFYTTTFTNLPGVATGIVGSFGYWLAQQEVQRGGQPWYYYIAVQLPLYEYLAMLGVTIAAGFGAKGLIDKFRKQRSQADQPDDEATVEQQGIKFNAIGFLGYWAVISALFFTYAGERMPWLTTHIALPMILITGWVIGKIIDNLNAKALTKFGEILIPILLIFGIPAFGRALLELAGWANPLFGVVPEPGRLSFSILVTILIAIITLVGAWVLARRIGGFPLAGWAMTVIFGIVITMTVRTSIRAVYQDYDYATEFLVYAHGERGVKSMLEQIDSLSQAVYGDGSMSVAYDVADHSGDSGVSWPITWYIRNRPDTRSFGPEITRDLRGSPAIIVSDNNWNRLEPLVTDSFQRFDYIRMVWPMQDYWNLTWDRISNVFKSAELREALWDIWFDRDYGAYGELTGRDYSLEEWQPSDKMRLYVRNDIIAIAAGGDVDEFEFEEDFVADPYQDNILDLAADQILGDFGTSSGQFQSPHGIAIAPDGSIYIADTENHRIQHMSVGGETLHVWGTLSPSSDGTAPEGTFNEPWGIAIAPDGNVLVADTWNHRIQKFSPNGTFITSWGEFGLPDITNGYYGPRDVVVDSIGRVYVTDTGNKRVSVHDSEGGYLFQVGSGGYLEGELDEPVGFDINSAGNLLIADTWNLRIQSFNEIEAAIFTYNAQWSFEGWYGQSIENKPYLAVGPEDQFCVTDPEGHRVLCFDKEGEYLFGWGSFGSGANQFNLPSGIAFDPTGAVWVVDSGNNRVMRFNPPWEQAGQG
jgi:uncharacterized protein (TIGR03663 family)